MHQSVDYYELFKSRTLFSEWKIHQINVEKNQLLEENAMLKKEIEIRKKLRDTEISGDHMIGKCKIFE